MIIYKCDLCGKVFDEIISEEDQKFVITASDDTDHCPDCVNEINNFIEDLVKRKA